MLEGRRRYLEALDLFLKCPLCVAYDFQSPLGSQDSILDTHFDLKSYGLNTYDRYLVNEFSRSQRKS